MQKEGGWLYSHGASHRKDVMVQNAQVCGHCGESNTHEEEFCENCGYELAGGPVDRTILSNGNTASTPVSVVTSRHSTGSLSAGNILSGRYRIVEMIGKGGFGAVYKARDERFPSKPVVALKEMSDSQLSPSERAQVLQDFHNEADLLVQLKHPNLPKVSDVFEEGEKAYLVMEFIEGKTLEQLQDEQNDPLDERLVMDWAWQLCAVLHYLHTRPQPIIFRDMKPANVMVTADGEVKLIDFGIARIFKAAVKKDTTLLGSRGYAPLEQYGHGQSDARSDIYALGATLYDLLTKQLPADAPSRRINSTLFSTPRQLNPKISPAIEALLLKAMADEPKDRYQTAADMHQAIAATGLATPSSSTGLTVTSSPTGLIPPPTTPPMQARLRWRPPSPVRSRRGRVLLIMLLVFGLLAVWLLILPPPPPVPPPLPEPTVRNGELIGLSDGKYVFDTTSPAGNLKQQAAQKLQQGDSGSAMKLLSAAHNQETSDAEVLIYQENIRAISGKNYITLVVSTILRGTFSPVGVGRDKLQAAYVAQREYNDTAQQHGGKKVRLVIANSGGKTDEDTSSNTSDVAKQIVTAAKQDQTIVGVMGGLQTDATFQMITPLDQAQIPTVSVASGDSLTGTSKYFFRATVTANVQGAIGAQYALQTLKATKAAIFVDPNNDYSSGLNKGFRQDFANKGGTIVASETYKLGDASTPQGSVGLETKLQDALQHNPDIIYFAGYAPDVKILLQHLQPSDPPVMGGNALYQLDPYDDIPSAGKSHLRFTAVGYSDEWDFLCSQGLREACSKPSFFTSYSRTFDDGNHQDHPYGYSRANSGIMLAYDATMAFLKANEPFAKNKTVSTGSQMQQALAGLTEPNALQGVTGQLSFGSDGNSINKAVAIVCNKDGFFKLDVLLGQFIVNGSVWAEYPATSVCA